MVIANDDTEGAGQFKCPQCDFCSNSSFDLLKHTSGHTGEKPSDHTTSYDDKHSIEIQVKRRKYSEKKDTGKMELSLTKTSKTKDGIIKFSKGLSVEKRHYFKGQVKEHNTTIERKETEKTTGSKTFVKNFVCPHCNYSANSRAHLMVHLNVLSVIILLPPVQI